MAVAGVGEVPPLIIPVDLGGGDWLEPVTGAAGMGWSGSCRRGSGEGFLDFGAWSRESQDQIPNSKHQTPNGLW